MRKKKSIILAGVTIIGILGFMFFQSTRPLKVDTIIVNKEAYKEYHFEEGIVSALDYVNIYSPVSSKILSINVEEGDMVKPGDILLRMDHKDLKYNLESLTAQRQSIVGQLKSEIISVSEGDLEIQNEIIAIQERNLEASKKDFENSKHLYDQGAISLEDFNESKDAYNNAKNQLNVEKIRLAELKKPNQSHSGRKQYYNNQIEMIDIEIARLKEKIEKATIIAPREGIVSDHSIKEGDEISENQFLFSISNSTQAQIETNVIAKYAKNISPKDKVEIEIDSEFGSQPHYGSVEFRSNYAKEIISPLGLIEKKVKVLIHVGNSEDLIIGEKVHVKFITYENQETLVISKDYIFPWKDGDGIWVIEDGLAKVIKLDKNFETASKILVEPFVDSLEIIIPPYPEGIDENVKVVKK